MQDPYTRNTFCHSNSRGSIESRVVIRSSRESRPIRALLLPRNYAYAPSVDRHLGLASARPYSSFLPNSFIELRAAFALDTTHASDPVQIRHGRIVHYDLRSYRGIRPPWRNCQTKIVGYGLGSGLSGQVRSSGMGHGGWKPPPR